LKPDCVSCDTDTPLEESDASSEFDGGATEIYTATNRVVSDSESIRAYDGSRDDGSLVFHEDSPTRRTGVYAAAQNGTSDSSQNASRPSANVPQLGNSDSQHSPNPRKRSAKTASLPDSISPDDECNDTRPKPSMTKIRPLKLLSKIARSPTKKGSFIPVSIQRAVSLASTSAMSENSALARSSTPSPEAVSPGIESGSLPAHLKSTTVESVPDEGTPPWHSPETPPNKIDLGINEPLTEANLLQRSSDRMSTRACKGSFSNTEESDEETEDLLISLDCIRTSSRSSRIGRQGSCLHRSATRLSLDEITERHEPKLVMDNRILYLQTSPTVYPATYEIGIMFKVRLQKGKSKDWWELVISGLPRLAHFESGYLYIRTPPGQGMEFVTSSFKRHTLVESCLMAQFECAKSLVTPLRKCSAEDFGYLKDYKVNAVIQSKIVGTRDPLSWLVKYNAVCSIDLINHSFWAKKCEFYLYVHGGPEGEFDAVLDTGRPFIKDIRLELAPGGRIGVSKINITSVHEALDMFNVCWEVKLPRDKAVTWLPWIKGTSNNSDAESRLQEEYELLDPMNHHDFLDPPRIVISCKAPCPQHGMLCTCEHGDVKVTAAEPEDIDCSPCPGLSEYEEDLSEYEEDLSANRPPSFLGPLATEPQESISQVKALRRRGMIPGNLFSAYPNIKPAFTRSVVSREPSYSPCQLLRMSEMPMSPNPFAPGHYQRALRIRLANDQIPETQVSEIQVQETEASEPQLPEPQLPEPQISASTVPETPIAKQKLRRVGSVLSSMDYLINILFRVITLMACVHIIYWYTHMWRDSLTLNLPCPHHQATAFHPMGHEEDHYAELTEETETVLPELRFQPMPLPSEFEYPELKQSANTVPANTTPMPLRDRIDYYLGWRGPIAQE
jgi:hypothetical protein